MLSDAEEKIEYEITVNRSSGYQNGYQEGAGKAREEVVEECKKLLLKTQKIYEEAILDKENIYNENENEIIEIAIKVAEKIVRKEIFVDREILRNILREAMRKVPVSKKLTILVNWEDLEYIKEIKQSLFAEIHGIENIEIIEDNKIERGGCILETSVGTINATISSKLELIYEKLMEVKLNEN